MTRIPEHLAQRPHRGSVRVNVGALVAGPLSDECGQSSRSSWATAALAVRPTPRMVAEPGPVQSP